jgi:soluble lytic murein transglycosylase-like protein
MTDFAERSRPWAPVVTDAARRAGIDAEILSALIWVESRFNPEARSPDGAVGLAQLMPATAAALGVDPADPAQNVAGAARYLREQLDLFHDVRLALEAYTRGPDALRAALAADPRAPLPYADAVLAVASAQ